MQKDVLKVIADMVAKCQLRLRIDETNYLMQTKKVVCVNRLLSVSSSTPPESPDTTDLKRGQ
jgi:hypothetical protein